MLEEASFEGDVSQGAGSGRRFYRENWSIDDMVTEKHYYLLLVSVT